MTTSTIDLPEAIENVMKIASCDRTLTLYYRRITFLQNTCNNNVSVKMCLFSAITYDTVLQVSVRAPLCTQRTVLENLVRILHILFTDKNVFICHFCAVLLSEE